MKTKFYTLINVFTILAIGLGCGMPRYAAAQSDPYYNNQQQQPEQQENADDDQYNQQQPQQDIDFNTFYDALSPYGTWEDDPDYGQVWVCNSPDFTPYYSGGNWAYSEAGWAWNSTYSWGWAPFHYGRWAYRNQWMWVPGYDWAPAWVNWRSGGDYYGWTPLGPAMSIGAGFGYADYTPANRWNFCQRAYITSPYFSNYCVGRGENINIIRNTTIINNVNVYHNTRFIGGPERGEVERYTGSRINTVAIRNAAKPGASILRGNELQIYRPNIRAGSVSNFNRGQVTARQGNYNQPYNTNGRRYNTVVRPNNAPANVYNNNNERVQQNRSSAYTPNNTGMLPRENRPTQPINQFSYNNRQQYQPQHQPQERQVQQQPAAQYQAPQRSRYQPQAERPQYQAQQQGRQTVYNSNRPDFQGRQSQSQPAQRQQYQAPQRSNNQNPAYRSH